MGKKKKNKRYHEMTVYGFTIDAIAGKPLVILKDDGGGNTIPIWISNAEALAIASELVLSDRSDQRGTKDLLSLFLETTGTKIAEIVIPSLDNGVFDAAVRFVRGSEEFLVDVRPYEALRAALRYGRPILVADEVLQRASVAAMNAEEFDGEHNARRFAEFLENLDPASLGKYPM